MSIGERIRLLRGRESLRSLGARISISKGFLSDIEHGRSKPSIETLKLLAEALQTTTAYLLGETDDPTGKEPGNISFPGVREGGVSQGENNRELFRPDQIPVPVYRMFGVCAGRGVDNEMSSRELLHYVPMSREVIGYSPVEAYFAVEVTGRSMEPRIPDGAMVVIDTSRAPGRGEICLASFRRDGGFAREALRYYYRDRQGGVELRPSEGSGIPPDIFSPEEVSDGFVEVVGVAVAILSMERL